MKKILILTNKMVVGGVEKALINILENIDTSKYEITIGLPCSGGEFEKLIPNNIKKVYLYKFEIYNLSKIKSTALEYFLLLSPGWLCNKLFIKSKYDICIAYSANMIYQMKGFKGRKICWIHDNFFPFSTRDNLRGRIRKFITNKYLKKCEKIVCVSSRLKKSIELYSNNTLKNVIVLRNPINIKEIEYKSKENIDDLDIPKCIKLITVGRLDKIKGYERLIEICSKLRDNGLKFNLWIVGGGVLYDKLDLMIKEYNLSSCVQLLGEKTNPYKYLKESDIFICSSFKEGYSTAISEAIILNNAIISTDCGGSDEILDCGKFGIITKNNESDLLKGIEKIISDEKLVKHYKNMSKLRKSIFNAEKNIRDIEYILDGE